MRLMGYLRESLFHEVLDAQEEVLREQASRKLFKLLSVLLSVYGEGEEDDNRALTRITPFGKIHPERKVELRVIGNYNQGLLDPQSLSIEGRPSPSVRPLELMRFQTESSVCWPNDYSGGLRELDSATIEKSILTVITLRESLRQQRIRSLSNGKQGSVPQSSRH